MYPASVEYLNRQRLITIWGGGLWEQRYIYIFPFFSFCECVCVWFCVWFCLYPFALTIIPRVLSVHFVFFFYYLKHLFFLMIFFLFILMTLFYFILLYIILSSSFFLFSLLFWAMWRTGSWCSSQASGLCHWGGRAKFRTLVHKRPPSSR